MRTTLRLDDALLHEGKRSAAKSGRILTALIEDALRVRNAPICVLVAPGPRHWVMFTRLCREVGIREIWFPTRHVSFIQTLER